MGCLTGSRDVNLPRGGNSGAAGKLVLLTVLSSLEAATSGPNNFASLVLGEYRESVSSRRVFLPFSGLPKLLLLFGSSSSGGTKRLPWVNGAPDSCPELISLTMAGAEIPDSRSLAISSLAAQAPAYEIYILHLEYISLHSREADGLLLLTASRPLGMGSSLAQTGTPLIPPDGRKL